jgi:hypothetical protein
MFRRKALAHYGCVFALTLALSSCGAGAGTNQAQSTPLPTMTAAPAAPESEITHLPVLIPAPAAREADWAHLDSAVRAYAATTAADFSAAVFDEDTGQSWMFNPGAEYLEASLVKVPMLLTLFRQATAEGRELTADEEYLSGRMIQYSDNEAARKMYRRIGGAPELAATYKLIGISRTIPGERWGITATNVEDQLRIMRTLAEGAGWLRDGLRQYLLGLMESVDPGQAWGVSAGAAADGAEVALKNGWLPDDNLLWNVNSVGIINAYNASYTVAVLSSGHETVADGVVVVEKVARMIYGFEVSGTVDGARDEAALG